MKIVLSCFLIISLHSYAFSSTIKLEIGTYKSRAIFSKSLIQNSEIAPTVILIPGSGANGPEEVMPSSLTLTGKPEPLFNQIAQIFRKAGFHTMQLGKPGVNFYNNSFDSEEWFYDKELYANLLWNDLLNNVDNAYNYLLSRNDVDTNKIYLLGHSEGTKVAIDYTSYNNPNIKGLFLFGYSAEDLETTVIWQLFYREIEHFIIPNLDSNQDSYISKNEANSWEEFTWDFQEGQDEVSIEKIQEYIFSEPNKNKFYEMAKNAQIWKGVFSEGANYERAANLVQPLFVFTGEHDMQTRASEAIRLGIECKKIDKNNCFINIIPGVGHGFSKPKGVRQHPLLDISLGPIDSNFSSYLELYLKKIKH